MPKFTIECTYHVPMFRHSTYEAENVEAAIAAALADEDWSGQKADPESIKPHTVTGIWEGEDAAYSGPVLPCPEDPAETLRNAGPDMLAALQIAEEQYENFAHGGKDDGTLAVIRGAIAKVKSRPIAHLWHDPNSCVAEWNAVFPRDGAMVSVRYPSAYAAAYAAADAAETNQQIEDICAVFP